MTYADFEYAHNSLVASCERYCYLAAAEVRKGQGPLTDKRRKLAAEFEAMNVECYGKLQALETAHPDHWRRFKAAF